MQGRDLSGMRFGRLVAVRRDGRAGVAAVWLCRCDCGAEKRARAGLLIRGDTKSCGCLRREFSAAKRRTHGLSKTRTYISWGAMRRRCLTRSERSYPEYGGRGITICERWNSFENFLTDMGERPPGKSLDRKDNDGNYEPANCRWATPREQNNNRRPKGEAKRQRLARHCAWVDAFVPLSVFDWADRR